MGTDRVGATGGVIVMTEDTTETTGGHPGDMGPRIEIETMTTGGPQGEAVLMIGVPQGEADLMIGVPQGEVDLMIGVHQGEAVLMIGVPQGEAVLMIEDHQEEEDMMIGVHRGAMMIAGVTDMMTEDHRGIGEDTV